MKKLILILFTGINFIACAQEKFSNCSAVFLNDQMIVEEYSDVAKARISKDAHGLISAGTVNLGDVSKGEKKAEITGKFEFGVAIKDGKTGTIMMYSDQTFKKIEAEKILSKCKKGDAIVILTTKDQYALPHNEILVY